MTAYYFDTSAIVKRYLPEVGTNWVRSLVDPASGNIIMISEVTIVEVAAALAARHRDIGRASLTFVASDSDLVTAASAEGLAGDDPLRHP